MRERQRNNKDNNKGDIMGYQDIAAGKSKVFAVEIVGLYKRLCREKKEFVMARQIIRSGTSIGVNLAEGQFAFSRKDLVAKKSIALKKCAETLYWLELLQQTGYIEADEFTALTENCTEILKLLIASIKTLKANGDK
jgi:four helix bundle protein